jgi:hypothetical protein
MVSETPSLIDPFHRALYSALMEQIHRRVERITQGDVNNFEDYKQQVGYIQGLNAALDECQEIEKDLYSSKPREDSELS